MDPVAVAILTVETQPVWSVEELGGRIVYVEAKWIGDAVFGHDLAREFTPCSSVVTEPGAVAFEPPIVNAVVCGLPAAREWSDPVEDWLTNNRKALSQHGRANGERSNAMDDNLLHCLALGSSVPIEEVGTPPPR